MNPQPGHRGRDAHMEAIDLTLSSPEPEVRPRHQVNLHTHQQQPAMPFIYEPRQYRHMSSGNKHSQRQGSVNVSQQQPRQISPQHIRQLIDTSSHSALRDIVLQLCKTSPALSGALARGLAPHSSWAQDLMRTQKAKSRTRTPHKIKSEPRAGDQDAYDRMKQRLGTSNTTQSSDAPSRTHHASPMRRDEDNLRIPPSSQKVKRENRPSNTDLDDSTNIVDFSASRQDAVSGSSHRHAAASSSTGYRSHAKPEVQVHSSGARLYSTDLPEREDKPKFCTRCHEWFEEGPTNCLYHHPGRKLRAKPGEVPQYACCNKYVGEPGCSVGPHIS